MSTSEYALIVAGGKGTRIKSDIPKQFLELGGQPILLHTIKAFLQYSPHLKIILVLPQDEIELWQALVKKYNFNDPIVIQQGGQTRFQSVRNGLQKIEGNGLVAIHDGVRPLVSREIIAESFRLAAIDMAVVASVPLKESLRMINKDNTQAVDRSRYRLIQTPQTFDVQLIKRAYTIAEEAALTDDASVAERAGYKISLFEGSYENIKITTPEDLIIAEALIKVKAASIS